MSRIAYRQFPWQKLDFSTYLIRFYKIFSNYNINQIIYLTTGLTTKEILRIGMLLYSFYLKHPAITLPIDFGVPEFSKDRIDKFLVRFAANLSDLKTKVESEQNINDQFLYCGVAVRYYPLIIMQYQGRQCLVCPLPTLFFWRITSGLFYEIFEHKEFGTHFGKAFENYIGNVFEKVLTNSSLRSIKEAKYKVGKDEKDTTDWILCDSSAGIFIECKTKKMRNASKTRINDIGIVSEDHNILANAIVQCYRTIADYNENLYPNLVYDPKLTIYPLILTVEDWYIFNPQYENLLRQKILEGLRKKKLPENFISLMPYSFCPVDEFEIMIQVIAKVGIKNFFEPKVRDQEKNGYAFSTYYYERFPEESKMATSNIFDDEYKTLFGIPNI